MCGRFHLSEHSLLCALTEIVSVKKNSMKTFLCGKIHKTLCGTLSFIEVLRTEVMRKNYKKNI